VFEWDPAKAARSESKHGVSFSEAASVFADPLALDGADIDHSSQELRFRRIGKSLAGRILTVVYTVRGVPSGETIRIISARSASRKERTAYSAAS
jgi:uncharacterized DUF497 family protein